MIRKDKVLQKSGHQTSFIPLALLAGFSSILVSNFFGFSVVPVQIQLFLYPAMALATSTIQQTCLSGQAISNKQLKKLDFTQKSIFILLLLLLVVGWSLLTVARYWYADLLYAKENASTMQATSPQQEIC